MIDIGCPAIKTGEGKARLSCLVSIGDRQAELWMETDEKYAPALSLRGDAFVALLLPVALRRGLDIRCAGPVSARLLYQLENYYIPTLSTVYGWRRVSVSAPAEPRPMPNAGGAATGFTGGVDSLYSVWLHTRPDTPPGFRLTHAAVFNVGAFKGSAYREYFKNACRRAEEFASEAGLETVFVDSNFNEALRTAESVNGSHSFASEMPFRNIAAAMALGGLLSRYYYSSGEPFSAFSYDLGRSARDVDGFDLLTTSCFSSDSLTVYCSGAGAGRLEKLRAISGWEPSFKWLNSCCSPGGPCGVCRKCVMAQVVFHCLGTLESYGRVFDLSAFHANREALIAKALADDSPSGGEELHRFIRENTQITPEIRRLTRLYGAGVRATDRYFGGKGTDVPFKWIK